ncbi:uncharacterized protein si:dkey-33c12.4 isoform X2 [Scophthalmus maximus]|uniref:uncharacterized protein si:dkey-33c12.4 isoform X2 n=1 Tax=Scophthalmus maximus TaxID=52904 RepID=UPI001FA93E51|nr:uncharacterized protein si:dkey-33c12.4 isoform X2 [Scophthalmus maximus]
MPRKKAHVRGVAPQPVIQEDTRLMRTHLTVSSPFQDSMVDFIKATTGPIHGFHAAGAFLNVLTSGLFAFRNYDLEDDLIYSDDDDDDDDYHICPYNSAHRPIEPHPQIRQLTEEEANKHAEELIAEEERRKEKTEKNKRKKMRQKEKKRLEKENAVKEILPEEERCKSDSSENLNENPVIESNTEGNESPECDKTQNETEAVGHGESSGGLDKTKTLLTMDKKDEEEKESDFNNSLYACSAKPVPEETCDPQSAKERKKGKRKSPEVQQLEEEKPKVMETPDVQKKEDEKEEPDKEKPMGATVEEFAKMSRELAATGNLWASSGQYEMAMKCFTDAIKFNPKEFRLFGNRSLCYERMHQYENALRDADLALSMEPSWIKGLFRKGKALCGLKRYYEASLIYKEVLKLEDSSAEAKQEIKRAQTLHLMEMGFSWTQSSEALKKHATLEEAVEALFCGDVNEDPGAGASADTTADYQVVQEVEEEEYDDNEEEGEWIVLQPSRPRTQQIKEFDAPVQSRSNSQSPTPHLRNSVKPPFFSVWVGSLAPAVTYSTLHELFSRVGAIYSIKMLLEHQCAFVNYTRKEDCDRAIQCFDGMVLEGAPLSVRGPSKYQAAHGFARSAATDPFSRSGQQKKECFFWRTSGCTRQDCTFRHVPEHKNIDKDKFTSRLGNFNT